MVQTEYTGIQNLYAMINYSINQSKCRRYLVAQHFGEIWREEDCKDMCDICVRNTSSVEEDVTLICKGFLEILDDAMEKDQRLTAAKLIDLWKHSNTAKQFSKEKTTVKKLEIILAHCIMKGVLQEDYHFTPYTTISYILGGPKGYAVKSNRFTVKIVTVAHTPDEQLVYPMDRVFNATTDSSAILEGSSDAGCSNRDLVELASSSPVNRISLSSGRRRHYNVLLLKCIYVE